MPNRKPGFDPQDRGDAAAQGGVGVPVKGDSSGSNASASSSDSPTMIDLPKAFPDPDATMVDLDATMVDGIPPPPPLARPGTPARPYVAPPSLQPGSVLGN